MISPPSPPLLPTLTHPTPIHFVVSSIQAKKNHQTNKYVSLSIIFFQIQRISWYGENINKSYWFTDDLPCYRCQPSGLHTILRVISYLIITITNSSNIIGALAALFFINRYVQLLSDSVIRTIGCVFVGVFDFSEIEIVMIKW